MLHFIDTDTQMPPCRNRQIFPLNGLKIMKWSYCFTDSCNKNTVYFVLLYCILKNCVAHNEKNLCYKIPSMKNQ